MANETAAKKAKWLKTAKVIYWTVTILFVFAIGSGGVMMLIGSPANVQGVTELGYPAYLCTILGVAKVLGSLTILFGGKFPTLKEWAYAGISFDLLGASASYILHGGAFFHIIAPLVLWVLVLISHRQWKTGWM